MPSKDRERRTFAGLNIIKRELPQDGENQPQEQYRVEGYASTFTPYTLYSFDGIDYREKIDPHAFDEADMNDVKFLYNHDGHVYARTKGGTLQVNTDTHGLHVTADLSSTAASRQMYEEISTGLVDQMSFAFTVREDSYDIDNHMRTVLKIEKLYDVSAVSEPANPDTDISPAVRDAFHGAMEAAQRAEGLAEQAERPVEDEPEDRQAKKPVETDKPKITTRGEYKPMTYNEISYLNAKGLEAKATELETRKAELNSVAVTEESAKELRDLNATIQMINDRKSELEAMEQRQDDAISVASGAGKVVDHSGKNPAEIRAEQLLSTGKVEFRQLLTKDCLIPAAYKEEIGELPETISTIVDDVNAFSLEGQAGSWQFAYRKTDAKAAAVTEGETIGGTAGTFGTGEIKPETWGILDEISALVKQFTPLQYEASIRNNAYLALRRYAKAKIAKAIVEDAAMVDKVTINAIDENFLRAVVLGFNADESVAGGAKLYLTKATLQKIGAVRGTNEKRALYDIAFTDDNNGTVQEGGLVVNFSILSDLGDTSIEGIEEGKDVLIYGQMKSVDLPLWGNYTVETDEGGDYFKRNMMGIRGLQSAGVGVTKLHTVQVITVSSDP